MKKFIAAVVLLSTINCRMATADGINFVHDKRLSEVLEMAKAQNKLIFMDCYTVWCGPCKRLAASVFPDKNLGEYFNEHFINVKFEMQKDPDGPDISNDYSIHAFPTLLWIDGNGKVVFRHVGGLEIDALLEMGQKILDPTPGIVAGLRAEYDNGKRDPQFLREFLNKLNASGQDYDSIFKEYLEKLTEKELSDSTHIQTIFNLTNHIQSPGMSYLTRDRSRYTKLITEDAYNKKINGIAIKAAKDASGTRNQKLFDDALELLKSNKGPDSDEQALKLSMDYYSRTNDWANYDKNASAFIKKFAAKNPAVLNEVAWNYFLNINNRSQLQKATKWAYQALNTDNKYTYNLTYAYLLYKQEIFKEAQRACDYAVVRANEENVTPTSASALKSAIDKTLSKPQNQ